MKVRHRVVHDELGKSSPHTLYYTINFTTHFATAGRHHHTLSCRLDVVNVKLGEHAREVYSAVGCVVQRYVPEAC
jgi:hypothetical protein